MLHIKNLEDGIELFKSLGSALRVRIMKILLDNNELNMNELASSLGITNGALTNHIKKLEECGLINVLSEHSGHGNQKICRVNVDRILIDVKSNEAEENVNIYSADVPIGQYTNYKLYPTCGIATTTALIGEVDDPRYFAHPDCINAKILWFSRGYIEYLIPNLLPNATKIDQITLSMEICSEAPGVNNNWPSDISFHLNDVNVGTWTSPGDSGDVQGIFTPEWWLPNWNQYGLLKMIIINKNGTFVDGLKISNVTINQFNLDFRSPIRFKLIVADDATNVGGLTLFGSNFGNYNQDIKVLISYSPMVEHHVS